MRHHTKLLVLTSILAACTRDPAPTAPPKPDPGPEPPVLLQDVVIPNLPSPFYHFEYDATGRLRGASYASDLFVYDIAYEDSRISELRNKLFVNGDRLQYVYDDAGKVALVKYVNATGTVFTVVAFTYEGQQLTRMERSRRVEAGFIIDKTMSFTYYADGNLKDLTEHRLPIDGFQPEATTVDHYDQYDDKVNVDGFSLIHDDFFDHLVLLPGVPLQKGNPGKQIHTGDGDNYTIDFRYTYDGRNRPLSKLGDLKWQTGPRAGETFQTSSFFSYYASN